MNGKNKVLKAGIWYTICNFFIKGLVFITMPIFTRLMTSHDIGVFSNITSWFNILAIVTTFEIYSSISVARFDYKEELNDYISSSLVLGSIITAIFYLTVIIFNKFFTSLLSIDFFTLNLIFIYLLFYPSVQVFLLKNQIEYNYKKIIIISLLNAVLSTFMSIIFVLLFSNKLLGRTIGYFAPLIIVSMILYISIIFKGNKVSCKYWKYALKISFPLIWHLLAGYLLNSSDKIMITKMISAEANALYSVAYTISMVVSILWMSMNNAWSPWAYEQMNKKEYNVLKSKSKPYTIFFLLIVFVFMLISPELLLIMGGKKYVEAKYVIPPVMLGYVFQFIYSLYVNIEFYHKKQMKIALGTIIAAIVNIILNYIFIPIFGYIAAAYTTLIGYLLLFIIHYYFVKRMNCNSWYDTKFFIFVSFVSLLFMIVILELYHYNMIRYIIILVITMILFIICLIKRKELSNAIKEKSIKSLLDIFIKKRRV